MAERRYTDAEVEQILAAAAQAEATGAAGAESSKGMTIAEIQQIAAEAGLQSSSVVTAAAALARRGLVRRDPRLLGVRSGVNVSVPLVREVSDAEWQDIVAVLRDTFHAAGHQEVGPRRREWWNGNLRIAIESAGGQVVLDMRTQREGARLLVRAGLTMLGGSGALAAGLAVAGTSAHALPSLALMTFVGASLTLRGMLQLPWWARSRQRQFEAIAEYTQALTDGSEES